jgi:hypothetical protein
MRTIRLEWKDFNVNTMAAEAAIRAIEPISGVTAGYGLDVHILNDEVSQDQIDLIQMYWDDITLASPEATGYESQHDRDVAKAAKEATDLAAATTILKGLGLTDDQIAALRG